MPANPGASRNAADRVQVAPVEGAAALFTPEFRDYLVRLYDEFTPARARAARRAGRACSCARSSRAGCPGRCRASAATTADWKVPPVPDGPAQARHRDLRARARSPACSSTR